MSNSPTTTAGGDPMGLARMRRAPTHPGTVLAELLRDHHLTQAEAARRLGVTRAQLNHVRTGLRPMPLSLCVKVAALTSTSAEMWATLQMRHDLWHAMNAPAVVAALRGIVPIEATDGAAVVA
ncbi:MAG: HigA family addiction module antitoxin [Vicinamibacterales bacterium]